MKNQIEIVKDIADGMIGIGGMPSNEEFYAKFDMRVRTALRIHDVVGQSEQLQGFFEFYKQKFGGGFNTDVLEITLKQYQKTLQLPTTTGCMACDLLRRLRDLNMCSVIVDELIDEFFQEQAAR